MTVPSKIVGRDRFCWHSWRSTPVLPDCSRRHQPCPGRPRRSTLREWCARGNSSRNPLPPDFHFSFVLLQEVEKRLRAFAGIASNDSMHHTPPTADVLHVNAAGTRTDLCVLHTALPSPDPPLRSACVADPHPTGGSPMSTLPARITEAPDVPGLQGD